jgi:hypothetical protein
MIVTKELTTYEQDDILRKIDYVKDKVNKVKPSILFIFENYYPSVAILDLLSLTPFTKLELRLSLLELIKDNLIRHVHSKEFEINSTIYFQEFWEQGTYELIKHTENSNIDSHSVLGDK